MLPYLYEFHWSAGHLTFLGIFGGVALTVLATLLLAGIRAARHLRAAAHEASKQEPTRAA
jgi:hypothetical protein